VNGKALIIAGCGGFGAEAIWVAEDTSVSQNDDLKWNVLGYVDDDRRKAALECYGYKVLGSPEVTAPGLNGREVWYFCAIGDNSARQRMAERLDGLGWRAATLIHPSVVRARNVQVGEGTYVGALSILSPNCTVGRHVIINQHAAIGHDAHIGDFSNICPSAQINGSCRIGRGALIGSHASVMQGRSVGENAVVGANSLVIRAVPSCATVIGVPAKTLFQKSPLPLGEG
jgi:sugar O-acyltransferase (sialic acid O-acetyltransferase NeuD family)